MTLQIHINSTDNNIHKNVNVRGSILNKGRPESPPGTLKYTSLQAYFSDDATLQIIEQPSMPKA
jgi:hypothetical protein